MVAAAAAVVTAALAAPRPGPSVVVRDARGAVVAQAPLPADGRFGLSYRHSVYEMPAVEHFAAGPGGTFRLVGISSPSEAVLDYYALDGARRRDGDGWYLDVADAAPLDALPLAGTAVGERTLVTGERRQPLFGTGAARHLTLDLER